MHNLLVYGSSLFLDGLLASLKAVDGLCVVHHEDLNAVNGLSDFDAVLIDLNDPVSYDVLRLLRARPDLNVIGVNASSSAVTMFSGKVYLAQNVDGIITTLVRFSSDGSASFAGATD